MSCLPLLTTLFVFLASLPLLKRGRQSNSSAQERSLAIRAYREAHPEASLATIAAQFGVSRQAVSHILKQRIKAADGTTANWATMRQAVEQARRIVATEMRQYGPYQAASTLMSLGYTKSTRRPVKLPFMGPWTDRSNRALEVGVVGQ